MEQWRRIAINGMGTNYDVSDQGRVKSLGFRGIKKTGHKLVRYPLVKKAHLNSLTGYLMIGITVGSCTSKTIVIHRLVAKAFIPNPNDKREVNHINGIKTDNRAVNLEWVSASENARHKFEVLGQSGPNTGILNKSKSKPVIQLSIETGEEINRFPSAAEAQRQTGVRKNYICSQLIGKQKSAGGYYWKYA